ncbi:hypothetical protein MJA45_18950 [Paenibacillus aurantius]|uniref:Uncharacterized protein n=1 Tax=Paenibacillus aurantius TaxID=2918900 RepID=A0AA96LAJ3_9BACL|nr:hypothetical protein [Paenibacillus aurantius]WJH34488.1 hypothetical protein N6H14_32590 [Paenibacillus sp. CC-CFT747]WNQ09693.1 hypothetical protein MJA45_18950 [Paenibacillus aurantius]
MAMNAIDLRKPPQPTESEAALVRKYVLLPVLLTMLQRDIDAVTRSALKVSLPYIVIMQRMMDTVREDLSRVRSGLGKAGIRIYTEEKNAKGIQCKYVCRGYHESFTMSRDSVKAEVSLLAGQYVDAR